MRARLDSSNRDRSAGINQFAAARFVNLTPSARSTRWTFGKCQAQFVYLRRRAPRILLFASPDIG